MSLFTGNHYYHQTTKSFITVFGSIFNDITVEKYDVDGNTVQQYEIPIDHAPKNKWLTMFSERPDYTTNQVQMTLPRLAFEILDPKINMARKIGFNGTYSIGNMNNGTRTKIFNPIPVDVTVALYAITKDNEDMLQIIEQIIPYFQPTLIVNMNLLPEFNIFKDIPISLIGYSTDDNYTGSPDEQRLVQTTFTFTAQLFYFGPIADKCAVINDVKISFNADSGKSGAYEIKVDPPTATSNATPHTFIESWT